MYWVLLWSIPITRTRGCGKECIIIYSKIIVSCWAVNTEQAKQKHYGKINGEAKLASLSSKQETWTLSQLPTVVTVSSFPHDRCMFNDFDRVCFFLHNWIWLYPPSRELAFKGDRKKISNVRVFSLRDAVQLLDWHSSSCAPRNIYICEQLYSTWFYLYTPSAFLHSNHCCDLPSTFTGEESKTWQGKQKCAAVHWASSALGAAVSVLWVYVHVCPLVKWSLPINDCGYIMSVSATTGRTVYSYINHIHLFVWFPISILTKGSTQFLDEI